MEYVKFSKITNNEKDILISKYGNIKFTETINLKNMTLLVINNNENNTKDYSYAKENKIPILTLSEFKQLLIKY